MTIVRLNEYLKVLPSRSANSSVKASPFSVHRERHCIKSQNSFPGAIVSACRADRLVSRISERGISVAELAMNMAIILILASMSLPAVTRTVQTYRLQSDARRIYSLVTLARMRAAADFTKGELSSNLAAGTYQIMLYDKPSNSYVNEGGTQSLSSGNSFSYGTITVPAGTQNTIAQSAAIVFNSRGIPVDSGGTPTGNYVLYLSNGSGLYYAISVSITGTINIWSYNGGIWTKTF